MPNTPTCSLCTGPLVKEKKVEVDPAGQHTGLRFALAWVCCHCSTAFPIALGSGGIIREAKPLYVDGVRHR